LSHTINSFGIYGFLRSFFPFFSNLQKGMMDNPDMIKSMANMQKSNPEMFNKQAAMSQSSPGTFNTSGDLGDNPLRERNPFNG
jgi:hypothetical protein